MPSLVRSQRWVRLKDALSLALKRPRHQRHDAADAACAGHPSLRDEVSALLRAEAEMGSFLEYPLAEDEPAAADDGPLPASLREWTRYEIAECLGRGGMAAVYKAWDPRLHRMVAIKLIAQPSDAIVHRFLREAESQARVEHDNVLKVFETGTVGAYHYIAMQYVNGPTLLGVRDETTVDQKVRLILQVADGLQAAHARGLVHRDIKPGNILVERTSDGLKPFLLDFGLAVEAGAPSQTQTGMVVGTPRYMAPERLHGGAGVDRRSDIYSLGATFYEFLSGSAPFASTGLRVLVDVMEAEITPLRSVQPALAPELAAIVTQCLDKDPARRYPSARALADDLQRHLDGDAVTARPAGPIERLVKRARKHPGIAAALSAMAASIVMLGAWSGYGYWRTTRQTELARRLGEEIRDAEWLYRAAEMSPLHAIEPQKQQVRQAAARVAQLMSEAGSLAFGPGHYALGRASLTLGDNAEAVRHLTLAWDSGYHTADAAAALGLAHDEIFRAESAKAQRIESDDDRSRRLRELNASHRDPALRFLEAGRSSTIVPARYVDALIASDRGDVDGAIDGAEAAAHETPWLFEARVLQGHLAFNRAVANYLRRNMNGAGEQAARSDRYYQEASRVASSSIDAYLGRCAIAGLQLHMSAHEGSADPDETLQHADESCARALTVDPNSNEGHLLYGEAVQSWAMVMVKREKDPGQAFDRAAALVQHVAMRPEMQLEQHLALGDILVNRAWWESRIGRDPTPAIDHAIASYTQALAIDPRNVSGADNLGQTFILLGRWQIATGAEALASLDRAIAAFQMEIRLAPTNASGYLNLTRAAIGRATEQARHGLDPKPGLEAALRSVEAVNAPDPPANRADAIREIRARLGAEQTR